jgi:hypothetical protein
VFSSVGFPDRRLHETSVLGSDFSGVSGDFFWLCFFDIFFRAKSVLFGWVFHDTRLSMVEIDRWRSVVLAVVCYRGRFLVKVRVYTRRFR